MKKRVLIVGATSGIARAVAVEFARHGYALVLSGRDAEELERIATDLHLRFRVPVGISAFEALNFADHTDWFLRSLDAAEGQLGGVVVAVGYLGEQQQARSDFAEARRILDTNFTACVSVCNIVAEYLEGEKSGFICVLSSVAGDRGRQSNYLYGAAKGGLSVYLQGLRNRLHPAGVTVTTVKPGFVETSMTAGRVTSKLMVPPEAVAGPIYRAAVRGRAVLYVPWFWRFIMLAICSVPEAVFKRLKL